MEMLYLQLRDGKSVMICYTESHAPSYQIEWKGQLIGYMYIGSYDVRSGRPLWVGSSDLLLSYLTEISLYLEFTLGLTHQTNT